MKVPSRNGKQITLLDLSMQVSGLPRMPNNFKPADPANPYADYTPAKLYEFLSGYTLTRDIGEKYDYSNVGRRPPRSRAGPQSRHALRGPAPQTHPRAARA